MSDSGKERERKGEREKEENDVNPCNVAKKKLCIFLSLGL